MITRHQSIELVDSLRSAVCPACGGHKGSGKSLCFKDYRRLPGQLRTDLYRRLGEGYFEAVLAAFENLGLNDFHAADGRKL